MLEKETIEFEAVVYLDALTLLRRNMYFSKELDLKDEIRSQIDQGDPVMDSICDQLTEIAKTKGADTDAVKERFEELSTEEFMEKVYINPDNTEFVGVEDRDTLMYRVHCEFDPGELFEK